MQQHTMVPATIVDASTKIVHPTDGTQMSAMKRNMMPSIGTEQNMTISTLTRMEIMKTFKLVHLPLYLTEEQRLILQVKQLN